MSRMDDLVGAQFKILKYRELPRTHQLALLQFFGIDTDGWDVLFDQTDLDGSALSEAFVNALPAYVKEHGDSLWGVLTLDTRKLIQSVMADPDIASSYVNWAAYTADYCFAGDVPTYGPDDMWPVILSEDPYETLLDGWHRFHSYARSGFKAIPAIFSLPERLRLQAAKTS